MNAGLTHKKMAYNKNLSALVGEKIQYVTYFNMDFGEPQTHEGPFHDIDHGVQLTMESGKQFYLIWTEQYVLYDIKFATGSIKSEFPNSQSLQMSCMDEHPKWKPYIGGEIIKATSLWSYLTYQNNLEKTYYPEGVRLDFDNQKSLVIAAVEINEQTTVYSADTITVFFDLKVARSIKY